MKKFLIFFIILLNSNIAIAACDFIIDIGEKISNAVSTFFEKQNKNDPTSGFDWEYILIDDKKVKNAWCMPGGKIAV